MKQHTSLQQKMSLGMTPHMQQALKLLQMTNAELTEEIQAQHEENPFLVVELPDLARHSSCTLDALSNTPAPAPHWREVFLQEVRVRYGEASSVLRGAEILVEALDDEGFLPEMPSHEPQEELVDVLTKIAPLGPVGLFSHNRMDFWRTCLHSQGLLTATFGAFLQLIESGEDLNIKKICASLRVKEVEVGQMLAHLKGLPRSPLESFSSPEMVSWPDLLLEGGPHSDEGGEWQVALNLETLPSLALDRGLFQSAMSLNPRAEEEQFCRLQWSRAKSLCTAVEQRSRTLLIIAHRVLMAQKEFLTEGDRALKTLTLRDVSLATGYHESTISRAIANKTILTPFGVVPLKKFFRQGVAQKETMRQRLNRSSLAQEDRVSSTAVQSEIRRLIKEESPQHPLSDDHLAMLLGRNGWVVARRTVAKYREALNIPSSHQRRQFKVLNLVVS